MAASFSNLLLALLQSSSPSLWQTGFGFAQREEGEQMLQTIINYEQMDKEQELELQEEMMKYKRPFFPQQAHFLLQ